MATTPPDFLSSLRLVRTPRSHRPPLSGYTKDPPPPTLLPTHLHSVRNSRECQEGEVRGPVHTSFLPHSGTWPCSHRAAGGGRPLSPGPGDLSSDVSGTPTTGHTVGQARGVSRGSRPPPRGHRHLVHPLGRSPVHHARPLLLAGPPRPVAAAQDQVRVKSRPSPGWSGLHRVGAQGQGCPAPPSPNSPGTG